MPVQESAERLLRLAVEAHRNASALKQLSASRVDEARLCGASWADVGAAFGITRQAAHERFSAANTRRGNRAVRRQRSALSDTTDQVRSTDDRR
jgi:hypothetical protein